MVQDLLQWSDSAVGYSRAVFLLFMSMVQAAATRPFVQVSDSFLQIAIAEVLIFGKVTEGAVVFPASWVHPHLNLCVWGHDTMVTRCIQP